MTRQQVPHRLDVVRKVSLVMLRSSSSAACPVCVWLVPIGSRYDLASRGQRWIQIALRTTRSGLRVLHRALRPGCGGWLRPRSRCLVFEEAMKQLSPLPGKRPTEAPPLPLAHHHIRPRSHSQLTLPGLGIYTVHTKPRSTPSLGPNPATVHTQPTPCIPNRNHCCCTRSSACATLAGRRPSRPSCGRPT